MKLWRLISLLGFSSMLGGAVGCAVETGEEGTKSSAEESLGVDSEMFDAALLNQARLEEAGHRLIGRVWFAHDGYTELYEREGGEPLAFFFARSGTKEAVDTELMPVVGEPLDSYVARAARGRKPRYLGSGEESGSNVLLFDAQKLSAPGDGLGTSREAVVNEFCPKAQYDSLCTLRWGYVGSTSVTRTWNVFDRTAGSFSGNGTSYMTVLCTDKGAATFEVAAPGGEFTPFFIEVPQGVWSLSFQGVGWHKTGPQNCDFIHWCCDYHDVPNRSTVTVSAVSSGGNLHSCGKVLDRGDRITPGCGPGSLGEPFRDPVKSGFLDASGNLSLTERSKFCSATCSRSCAGITGPGQSQCMNSCTSACMAG